MYESDSQRQFEQLDQFTFYAPVNQPTKKPINKVWKQALDECKILEKRLIRQKIQQKVDRISQVFVQNIKNKKSLITSIQIKKDQLKDLSIFIDLIKQVFCSQESQKFKYINMNIKYIQKKQIKQILASINDQLRKQKLKNAVSVFIVTNVSQLSQTNLYLFQKVLTNQTFYLVIPTFQDLQSYVSDRGLDSDIQVLYYNLYNCKDLFCQYMFNCLKSPIIKAYLPKQSIYMIDDYQNYPISFREGIRRLVFCIQKIYLLLGKDYNFVDFQQISIILSNTMKDFYFNETQFRFYQKMIKCILHDAHIYSIPSTIVPQIFHDQKVRYDQDSVIDNIRSYILHKLLKSQKYKHFADILNNQDNTTLNKKNNKKNDRLGQLGINHQTNKCKKTILQDQITLIIRKTTYDIRKQSAQVSWASINYEIRIRPELPKDIIFGIKKLSKKYQNLIIMINQSYSISLQQMLYKLQYELADGQIMYMLRDLQILGAITRNKKSARLSYLNTFFQPCNFSGR